MAIDTQVADWEHFVAAAINAEQFVLYDGENDTLGDVLLRTTEGAASSGNKIASLSILSHGQQGRFSLGNEWVSQDNLAKTAHHWSELGRHMADGANIYIFGCSMASPSADGRLVDALADLTGADIFASDDLTGVGGDWDLEVASRGAESELAAGLEIPFDVEYLAGYAATLVDYNETLWSGTDTFIDGGISFTLSVTGGGTIDWSYDGSSDTLAISDNDGTTFATAVTITDNNGGLNIDGITLDTDLGSLVSNVDIATINIADDKNIAAVTVAGGSGTIDALNYAGDVDSNITIDGNVNTVLIADYLRDTATVQITGNVGSITVGDWFGGCKGNITVGGDLSTLNALRIAAGAIIDIAGDAGTITVNDPISANDDLEGDLIVGGNLTSLVVSEDIDGAVTVGGTAGSISAGDDITGTIDITGSVTSITAVDLVTSDITIGGDLDSFSAATNFSGLLTANLVIGQLDIVDGATEFHPTYAEPTHVVYDGSTDGLNAAPTVNDQTFGIDENSINGTVVDTVIASDPDAGDTLTYSITAGNTDNAFAINPATGQITVNNQAVLDYETNPTFSLTVQVEDTGTLTDTATVTVNLNDLNETPTVNDQTFGIDENSINGTVVDTVIASDPDAGDTLTYSITAGNTGGAFAINPATGQITVNNQAALDYETNPTFSLTVQVEDTGTLTDTATVTVNLNDLNEVPTVNDQTFGIDENSINGTVVDTVIASDPDAGDSLTYSITAGNTGGAFAINPATGQITVNNQAALDYETNPTFSLTVQVEDTGTLTDTATVTVNLNDLNETPTVNDQTFGIDENSINGTVVDTVIASDPDAGDSLTYSITAGNTGGAFAINPATGQITVNNQAVLDYETNPTFSLTVQVEDTGTLTDAATVTINWNDLNEVPVINDQTFGIDENSVNDTVVDTVIASDLDAGDSLIYSITAGNTGNTFAINPATGQITVNNQAVLDYEINSTFSLTVQVKDTGGLIDIATVTINLNNMDDIPVINNQSFGVAENLPEWSERPELPELSVSSVLPAFSPMVRSDPPTLLPPPSGTFISVIPGSSTPAIPAQEPPAPDNNIPDNPKPDDPGSDNQETDDPGSDDQETDDRTEPGPVESRGDGDVTPIQHERNLDQLKAESSSIVKSVMANKEMSRQMEFMKQKMDQAADSRRQEDRIIVGIATSATVLSTIGYVFWLFRGGSLLASVLSTAPMWKRLDPFPILNSWKSRRDKHKNDKHKDDKHKDSSDHRDGDEEAEAMFER